MRDLKEMEYLIKPKYRSCPCINCLCFPVCSQKGTTFKIWDDCSLIYDFLFKVYEDNSVNINRLILVTELFNSPWKSAVIQYVFERGLDYHFVFQNDILE